MGTYGEDTSTSSFTLSFCFFPQDGSRSSFCRMQKYETWTNLPQNTSAIIYWQNGKSLIHQTAMTQCSKQMQFLDFICMVSVMSVDNRQPTSKNTCGKMHKITEQTYIHHIIVVSLHRPSLHSKSPITVFELWTHVPVIWSTVLKLNCQNNPLHCSAPDVSVYDGGRKGFVKVRKCGFD